MYWPKIGTIAIINKSKPAKVKNWKTGKLCTLANSSRLPALQYFAFDPGQGHSTSQNVPLRVG